MRLEHFYGPGDDHSKFVSSLIRQFKEGVPEILLTHGHQKRDFIYITDVVDAYQSVLFDSMRGENGFREFDVGSGRSIEIRKLVQMVQELFVDSPSALRFGALPYRPNEVMDSAVDLGPLRELGWSPRVPLEEGLRQTVEWERSTGTGGVGCVC